ncbi:MAG: phosphoribosylaminoimidazolesuccinocarboxamide synthase [Chloroflexi bacterium]|nr:phosphoribosylaminoimidazolesuccinocarboxamide synthase [Chloroflexota bacterium]
MALPSLLTYTQIPNLFRRGKVRDTYDLGDALLMVATDRVSAFDVVLPTGIPGRGIVLAELSAFWFRKTAHIAPNHFLGMAYDPYIVATYLKKGPLPDEIARRGMVIRKAKRIDVECVVRGYITGSAWAEYRGSGSVNGSSMPAGLQESQAFPQPLFTPTTKAERGHDIPLTLPQLRDLVGASLARTLEETGIALYTFAHAFARERGVIVADTKFEFGWIDGQFAVIDELLTPDSSRFWGAASYQPGKPQPSFDKQIIRDWLTESGWNKEPPAPVLPPEIVERTAARYREVFHQLTGKMLA